MEFDTSTVIRDLCIITIFAKAFGLLARKCKVPDVAGEIIAGLIIGPSLLNLVQNSDYLSAMAEIGVIMLMFSSGLSTNLRQLKKTGLKSTIIAIFGVFVPLICGTALYIAFFGTAGVGSDEFYKAIFTGTILTATSVSITAQTLKDLGKIKDEVATTVLSAAIIDDVIGIMVLTLVIGFKDPEVQPLIVLLKTILFFVFAAGMGYVIFKLFKIFDKKYPHTRRIPILGLALAFGMSYIADAFFGVADITGAFCAGVILCSLKDSDYINRKMDVNSYMIFGPVFFCSIGLKTDLTQIDTSIIIFSLAFVLVGMLAKVIGCGFISKMMKYSTQDSLKIGVGMMTRGEIALIVAQKGLAFGMLNPAFFTSVILLIVISSILTPIFLKILYKDKKPETVST
ncbi:MAG: cation:proton antiporter [Clostridiales bacterium]|nr:cation:proton antiporter [Clostridiales bacterium]